MLENITSKCHPLHTNGWKFLNVFSQWQFPPLFSGSGWKTRSDNALSWYPAQNILITQRHFQSFYVIAETNYECLFADAGSSGHMNDSGVWNNSVIRDNIENKELGIPKLSHVGNQNLTPL